MKRPRQKRATDIVSSHKPEASELASAPVLNGDRDNGLLQTMADSEHSIPTEASGADESSYTGAQVISQSGLSERDIFRIDYLRNVRYHEDRERFFQLVHRFAMFVVVAGGTASFAAIKNSSGFFVALITLAGLLDLVFDVSGKARLHASMRTRFYDLLARNEIAETTTEKLREQAIQAYADEPPCMHAVNALAYNGAMALLDRPRKYRFKIGTHHKWFRHVWAFASADFKTFEELAASDQAAASASPK